MAREAARKLGTATLALTRAWIAKIASAIMTAVTPMTGGGPSVSNGARTAVPSRTNGSATAEQHRDPAIVGLGRRAIEHVAERRQGRDGHDRDRGDEEVVGESVVAGGVRERSTQDEADGSEA